MSLISTLYASTALQARRAAGNAKPQATQAHAREARKPSACVCLTAGPDGTYRREVVPARRRVKWDGDYVA